MSVLLSVPASTVVDPDLVATATPAPVVVARAHRVRMPGGASEDAALVERMRAGDVEAFGKAYEKYASRVYAFALRRLRNQQEAEDLCQDVFVEVARSIRGFEGRSALSTWILGIASHEVANRYRRSRRAPLSIDAIDELPVSSGAAPVDDQVDSARMLARCADVLSREIGAAHRRIFELHLGGAPDAASIAQSVGKSRQAVKISLFRTRQRLGDRVAGLRDLLE